MARSKVMLSKKVILSPEYNGLSFEGRDAYVVLSLFCDAGGQVESPDFALRGRGLDLDLLDELRDAGLILTIGRETFITDFWLANERREKFTKLTEATEAWQCGYLGFEGEPFRSRFIDRGKYCTSTEPVQPKATQGIPTQPNASQQHLSMPNASTVLVRDLDGSGAGRESLDGTPPTSPQDADRRRVEAAMAKLQAYNYSREATLPWLQEQYNAGGPSVLNDAVDALVRSATHGQPAEQDYCPF